MNRKSQISLFIILGIVAVIVIVVLIAQRNQIVEKPESAVAPDVAPVRLFTEECFNRVAEEAVFSAAYQGGRAILYEDDLFLEFPDYYTSYNYYEGDDNSITKENSELLIDKFIQEDILLCLNNYSSLNQKVMPNMEVPEVTTSLKDDSVQITMDYPLTVESGNAKTELSDKYNINFGVRLKHMLDIGQELVKQTGEHPELVDFDYLSGLDMNATAVTYGTDSVVYILEDEKSKIGGEPLVYVFAAKLGEPYKVSNSNLKLFYYSGINYVNISYFPLMA